MTGTGKRAAARRLSVLAVTAFPGLQRAVVSAVVARVAGIEALGHFTSDTSLAMLVGFFTAVGWSSVILVRLPKAPAGEGLSVLAEASGAAAATTVLGCGTLALLAFGGMISRLADTCLFLAAWTGYQIFRHYFIAAQRYHRLLAVELLLLAAVSALVALAGKISDATPYRAMSLAFGVLTCGGVALLLWGTLRQGARPFLVRRGTAVAGLQFGLNNAISGGIAMLVPALVVRISGPAYGGLLGLISSVLGIVGLLPRAMALQKLPDLSRSLVAGDRTFTARLLKRFQGQMNAVLILSSALALLCWVPTYHWTVRSRVSLLESSGLFLVMLIALVASQFALPQANYLMATENSGALLRVNALASVLFVVGIPAVWYGGLSPLPATAAIAGWQAVSSAVKAAMTYRCYARVFQMRPSV